MCTRKQAALPFFSDIYKLFRDNMRKQIDKNKPKECSNGKPNLKTHNGMQFWNVI